MRMTYGVAFKVRRLILFSFWWAPVFSTLDYFQKDQKGVNVNERKALIVNARRTSVLKLTFTVSISIITSINK